MKGERKVKQDYRVAHRITLPPGAHTISGTSDPDEVLWSYKTPSTFPGSTIEVIDAVGHPVPICLVRRRSVWQRLRRWLTGLVAKEERDAS